MAPQPEENLPKDMAALAAKLYGALLAVRIPRSSTRPQPDFFTPDQAFTLVNTMFYEGLKDEGLL
jgi:hypothetical protein